MNKREFMKLHRIFTIAELAENATFDEIALLSKEQAETFIEKWKDISPEEFPDLRAHVSKLEKMWRK